MSLFDSLSKISEQIQSQRQWMNNEANTIAVSIAPFIQELGYNTTNLAEVKQQYTADPKAQGANKVDFAIMHAGKPILFIEAKAANVSLTAHHWQQLYEYFNAEEVNLGLLTNGIKYQFYADMEKPNIMDKEPFLEIDLLKLDKRKVEKLKAFTKTRFNPIKSIRFMKVCAKVEQMLNHPDEWLVKHVIYNIHEGPKWKTVIDEFRPLVKQAIDDYVENEVARRAHKPLPCSDPIEPDKTDATLPKPQTWLDGSVEIPVYASWNDHDFEATLRLRGKISNLGKIVLWDGKWLRPLIAGEEARKTVDPNAKGYVIGMRFWNFRDPADDKFRPIIDLRNGWHGDWNLILRVMKNAKQ